MSVSELVDRYSQQVFPPQEFIDMMHLGEASIAFCRAAWALAKAKREAFRLIEVRTYLRSYYRRSIRRVANGHAQ